jgi:hypothetical protein
MKLILRTFLKYSPFIKNIAREKGIQPSAREANVSGENSENANPQAEQAAGRKKKK